MAKDWLQRGKELLQDVHSKNHKLVAFALNSKGNLLSIGFNSYTTTHPLQAKFAHQCGLDEKIYLHAEMAALVKAKKQVSKIVVVRINNTGHFRNAKPCPICEKAFKHFGVTSVEYSV